MDKNKQIEEEESGIITEFNGGARTALGLVFKDLTELKKKYTESEDFIPAPPHTCPHIIPHTIESIADIAFQESEDKE